MIFRMKIRTLLYETFIIQSLNFVINIERRRYLKFFVKFYIVTDIEENDWM